MRFIAALLLFGTALLAQQPTIENAKLETRPVNGTLAAELTSLGRGPYWAGWSARIVPGQHGDVCSWYRNGNYNDSGRTPGAPVRLEGEIALVVLVRVENGQVGELMRSSPDCRLDAGGLPFYWLTNVSAAESIAWLRSQIGPSRNDSPVMIIGLHRDPAADQALDALTAGNQPIETRKRAALALGTLRGAHGVARLKQMLAGETSPDVRERVVLALSESKDPEAMPLVIDAARSDKDARVRGQALMWLAQRAAAQVSREAIRNAISNDPELSVKERAINALSQMPNGEGVPTLIEVAKSNKDPNLRKRAMQQLGQSKDPRALDFFAQVLKP
ncbi:MAG TPA: HEAT repeat domain-containing protein [Bryobacteraceae bacterium]|nr:HEAT repeat domain-containing protein [Bryobacteraceae bacterium]